MLFFTCFLWAFIFGFRNYGVGNDTSGYARFFSGNYYHTFYNVNYGTIDEPGETLEFGFILVSKIIRYISDSPTFYFCIVSFSMFFIIYKLYSPHRNGLLGLFFLFTMSHMYDAMMSMTRQIISITFVLSSILIYSNIDNTNLKHLISNKKFYFASFLFIFSIYIHRSSILFFPLLLIVYFFQNTKIISFVLVTVTTIISLFFTNTIADFLDSFLGIVSMMKNETTSIIGSRYADTFAADVKPYATIISWAIPSLISIYYTPENKINTFYYKCFIFSVLIYLLLNRSLMVLRIDMLFVILGNMVMIPDIIETNKKVYMIYLLLALIFLFKCYTAFNNWPYTNTNLPYRFVWE